MSRPRIPVTSLALISLLAILPQAGTAAEPSTPGASDAIGIEERIRYQAAVEDVMWRHRIWPPANPQPKPPLEAVLDGPAIRAKVEEGLRMSAALETLAGRPLTGADLQGEMDRQARGTRQPDVLHELWAALENEPRVIAEVLVRPMLAERNLRQWHEAQPPSRAMPFDVWWRQVGATMSAQVPEATFDYRLPELAVSSGAEPGEWNPTHALPEANLQISGVWTGSEMIIWGGTEVGASTFNSGSRYDPATDTWRTTSGVNAPFPRKQHTAVWTGTEMIVWGGCGLLDEHNCQINSGGRYDPMTDTWTATSTIGAPQARIDHTAVWTGTEMIVFGGCRFRNNVCDPVALGNSGGRYDPGADSWLPTTTAGAPSARVAHTAVWTGSLMIVWGGSPLTNTGGRYNPATDTWQPTSLTNAPSPRYDHSAVWATRGMIVWGGTDGTNYMGDGAAYIPGSNRWLRISQTGAPSPRARHSAVWTGTRMIVWGGCNGFLCGTSVNTGGRYAPATNSWTPTSTSGAPSARADHVAVWTGSLMVVWGGAGVGAVRTGGRYDPSTDTWTPTNANEATSAREWHTAVWTGVEMIVWGGDDRFNGTVNTGGRYTPSTDSWQPTTTSNAPGPRGNHTAVWTGTQMIIWGGQYGSTIFDTGGRYNPATNSWMPTSVSGAPTARSNHTAVWTGSHMIVWGGGGEQLYMTGGRYNPATNTWTPTSTAGAPIPRYLHEAVWTGTQMIVWGGVVSIGQTNTGGRYDPATNTWMPTTTSGAPEGRYSHAAVWTGSQMVVWGGASFDSFGWTLYQTGGRYDPATNTWTPTSTTNAPPGRLFFVSRWTGTALVVWGGCTDDSTCGESTFTGGEYLPATDTWVATTLPGAPSARGKLAGVWTGVELIVWGGFADDSSTYTNTGGRYQPITG